VHSDTSKIREKIFSSATFNFEEAALDVFLFQYRNNPVYQQFTDFLKINPKQVTSVHQIPFLPIEFFKTHPVINHNATPEKIFESSGTTGQTSSKHYVADLNCMKKVFRKDLISFTEK
jgi:phenylacetate-coenzyme A ligase PaaK-like adenylate-forming protein